MNPEFRQTLNTFSHNLESANQAAQENIYTFAQIYVDPCLSGFKACFYDFTAPCFPSRDQQLRRKRGRPRGRAELDFDFYDDWDDDEGDNGEGLGWGNDELDSLLAGSGTGGSRQPGRQRAMSYGSRARRKPGGQAESEQDPTVIPSSAYLGFLERLPWKLGSRAVRYKPSAADLQENPGGLRIRDVAAEPLIEESDEGRSDSNKKGHTRKRSSTAASRSTTNSLSSRGDLIMSDEEDDAVPLDDEFAVMLSRRTTNTGQDDHNSGKTGSSKPPGPSRRSTRTVSSKSIQSLKSARSHSKRTLLAPAPAVAEVTPSLTMLDLKLEEEQVRAEEELEIAQKRQAAQTLALRSGLRIPGLTIPDQSTIEVKPADPDVDFNSDAEPTDRTPFPDVSESQITSTDNNEDTAHQSPTEQSEPDGSRHAADHEPP